MGEIPWVPIQPDRVAEVAAGSTGWPDLMNPGCIPDLTSYRRGRGPPFHARSEIWSIQWWCSQEVRWTGCATAWIPVQFGSLGVLDLFRPGARNHLCIQTQRGRLGPIIISGWTVPRPRTNGCPVSGATDKDLVFTAPLSDTTYYRRIVSSGLLPADTSFRIAVNVHQAITNNVIAAPDTVCWGNAPMAFSPVGDPGGALGPGTYTYSWLKDEGGGSYMAG